MRTLREQKGLAMSCVWPFQKPQEPKLSDFAALFIHCIECGNERRLSPQTLASFVERGFHNEAALKPKLVCAPCKAQGKWGRHIDIIPTFRRKA
jgi:hypothetical protein